jgi:hypothetical protein
VGVVRDFLIAAGASAGAGLLLLVLLWPTDRVAVRLLRRWKITGPTPPQVAEAVRYLRRRRLLYPWLFVACSWPALPLPVDGFTSGLLVSVLGGTLLAELLALRPGRQRRRAAGLVHRGVFDLVSRTAVAVLGVFAVATLALAVAALAVRGWAGQVAERVDDGRVSVPGGFLVVPLNRGELLDAAPWWVLGGLVLTLLVVVAIVRVALVRPASGDPDVDAALRTRSAGVAVGVGVAVTGGLMSTIGMRLSKIASFDQVPVTPAVPGWLPGSESALWPVAVFGWLVALGFWWLLVDPPRRARWAGATA